jgi:hypothetical protein
LIKEAGEENTPAGYWDYLMPPLKRLESQWIAKKSADANLAPAVTLKTNEDDAFSVA